MINADNNEYVGRNSELKCTEAQQKKSAAACVVDEKRRRQAAPERVTAKTVRPDYARYPALTPAEAGLIAGVGVQTVRTWLRKELVKRARKIGPYSVDHESLLQFLNKGVSSV